MLKVEVKLPGRGISGGEINLKFEPSAFRVLALEPGELLGKDPLEGIKEIDNRTGEVKYALARVGPTSVPTPPGAIALIRLKVLPTADEATYTLEITKVGLADQDFRDIKDITVQKGLIRVKRPG